jgi:ubiquinone/menaquinone biosynthesis C-methylase UbiE
MQSEQHAIEERLSHTHWWFRGRRHIVRALWRASARRHGTFLDLGCGAGEGKSILGNAVTLVGIDVSEQALDLASGKGYASLHRGSAEALPFGDYSFDGILMLDVLEHCEHDDIALHECHRVLTESGILVVTVPAYSWLWSMHDVILGHKRRYTKPMLVQAAENAEFTVIFCSYYMTMLLPAIALYRLLEGKIRNARRSHAFAFPRIVNAVLSAVLCFEGILLLLGCRLPFGSSIVLVAEKTEY